MVFLAAWKFWGILPGLPDADLWLLELGTEDHTGWRHRQRCKRTGCDKGKLAFPVDRCGPQRFSAANHGFSQYGNDSLDIACGSAPAIIPEELQNASGLSACSPRPGCPGPAVDYFASGGLAPANSRQILGR